MRTGLRPALRLAGERLESGLSHLLHGLQWLHGTLDWDSPSIHWSLPCAVDAFRDAADIVALMWGNTEGICEDCEIVVATDGELCAGCHDSRGEAQDARWAEGM